jgi:membrane protein implicated in regulation of membrane protease activity
MEVYIWLGLMVVFLIVEASCPIHLVSTWFAAGSLVSAIVALLGGPMWLQILLFALVSGGLLICLWPFTKKFLQPKIVKTNVDALVGEQCYVTADIDNVLSQGQVKLHGMEWTARSADGSAIPAGTLVKVARIEGVKAFVTPVKSPVENHVSL